MHRSPMHPIFVYVIGVEVSCGDGVGSAREPSNCGRMDVGGPVRIPVRVRVVGPLRDLHGGCRPFPGRGPGLTGGCRVAGW